jgi:ABC-type transport system substrate-binding protein
MIDRKQEQIFSLGWIADYPDEQDFWQLFYGKNAGPGGLDGTNYSNPAFDALYEQTSTLGNSPERTRIYAAMQKMVLEDCPWIFTVYPVRYQLYHNWISNVVLSDYGHGYTSETRVDFDARRTWLEHH